MNLIDAIATLIAALKTKEILGKLGIVQRGQILIYQQESSDQIFGLD